VILYRRLNRRCLPVPGKFVPYIKLPGLVAWAGLQPALQNSLAVSPAIEYFIPASL
jgi:hypothetical protein